MPSMSGGGPLSTPERGRNLQPVMVLDPGFSLGAQVAPPNVEYNVVHIGTQALPIGLIGPTSQQLLYAHTIASFNWHPDKQRQGLKFMISATKM